MKALIVGGLLVVCVAHCAMATQRMFINISVQGSSEVSGFGRPMTIINADDTVSSETEAAIVQNTGSGLYIDVSPTHGNHGEPLTVSNKERMIPIKLVCKPCGNNTQPIDMTQAIAKDDMIYLSQDQTSSQACNEQQATCHFEVPPGSLEPDDGVLLGSVTLTMIPQG